MRALILTIVLLILAFVSLFVGVGDLSVSLITVSRVPRTAALILAGVGMSISGVIMQQMTQNKFVSPTTA
ncbi:MAG: iron chelate uptake ABC transporter family permease subunit, partial [Proteiniphilum sp.]|nr:iron chelate uptake ABC transporter family permease subunit [Proteiniphilum sp.]